MEEQKEKKEFKSEFNSREEFVAEAAKVISSLKDDEPFSLGVDMGISCVLQVDVEWIISFPDYSYEWTPFDVEFILSVLASRQTPNVKEIQLGLYHNELSDSSAEVWSLLSKFNNLTYLDIGRNGLSDIPSSVCNLIHLRELRLSRSKISDGFCELLKVCCSSVG